MNISDYRCDRGSKIYYVEQTPGIAPARTIYQHDKGEITYSKAFRRLAFKSQLITKKNEHARSKLLHSMEVSTIATEMSALLHLDTALTEAICLGHDAGSYPYSHIGELAVREYLGDYWEHKLTHENRGHILLREESVVMESADPERYKKLSDTDCYPISTHPLGEKSLVTISREVLDGILHHQCPDYRYENMPATVEAQVVRVADNFAYITQELNDASELDIEFDRYSKASKLKCTAISPIYSVARQESIKLKTKSSTWVALSKEAGEFKIDPKDIVSNSIGKRLNAMIYWFVGYNLKLAQEGKLPLYGSTILKKDIPQLVYPEGLSFILDYIWAIIIRDNVHNHHLVKHNYDLAREMVLIMCKQCESLLNDYISRGATSPQKDVERLYEIVKELSGGNIGHSNKRQIMQSIAIFISEMTDPFFERFFNRLWELF